MNERKVSQLQLFSMGGCYLMGTIIVSALISTVLGTESWIAGITGLIAFIPVLLVYFAMLRHHPGKSLFEMNEAVFGNVIGRILSLCYLLFFITLCSLNMIESTNFLSLYIMPSTPVIYITAVMAVICVYSVKKGLIPLARMATVFGIVTFACIVFYFLFSLTDANFNYLLPLFEHQWIDYIQSTHVAAAIPYGESIFLLMLVPNACHKTSMKKTYVGVALFTTLIMVMIHVRETISLGPIVSAPVLPSYEVARMLSVASTLSRTESVFALVLIALTLYKTILLFYICAAGIAQIFRLPSHRPYAIMLAIIIAVYGINAYTDSGSSIIWGENVAPFIWSFFTFILPLVTLVFSFFRRKPPRKLRGEV